MDSVIHTRRWSSLTIITLILHLQKVVERIVVLDSKSCEMNIPGNDRADSADKSALTSVRYHRVSQCWLKELQDISKS